MPVIVIIIVVIQSVLALLYLKQAENRTFFSEFETEIVSNDIRKTNNKVAQGGLRY